MTRRLFPLFLILALASPGQGALVEEYTRLYPVRVERIAAPRSVEEVRRLVRDNAGPISIGGGRYSMGGQTATEGALQIDMRGMDRVLAFSPAERTIRVEAGITWRKIQDYIDPLGLSLKIMQSYANFTVGGALSVNCHGRYVNQGPVIRSVRSLQIVLADGRIVEASPTTSPEVFYAAIGGYGAIGVITAATLDLELNEPLERTAKMMPIAEYPAFFAAEIKGSTLAVFHNGDIYPPEYVRVAAVTYARTTRPVTVKDRLQPRTAPSWKDRFLYWWLSERTCVKRLRAEAVDPVRLKAKPVVWRNYEASYDVAELEPFSRQESTYVLQEYFVPVERFGEFTPKMAEIFRRRGANVINVSVRHAEKDPGAVMAWARSESFAFVIWYKQGTSAAERGAVEVWTRELITAAIAAGGTYYLPYQIVATPEQFHAAYPRAKEFFALKKKFDPSYKFRNKLWDAYLPPPADARTRADAKIEDKLKARSGWARAEERTFLTLPEWDIVYAADELSSFQSRQLPGRFPYFTAVRQFWSMQAAMRRATEGDYPPNRRYRLMIAVIGARFTVDCALKSLHVGTAARAAPAPVDLEILSWVRTGGRDPSKLAPGVRVLERFGPDDALVAMPRYQKFLGAAAALVKGGVRFVEIAGNRTILATVLAPAEWDGARLWGGALGSWPLLAEPDRTRFALAVPVPQLHRALADWAAQGVVAEHLYDY